MPKQFKGSGFEVLNQLTPYKKNKTISVLIEIPENTEIEKQLIDFKDKHVKATMDIEGEIDKKHSYTDIFTFWVQPRHLKNGNKLQLILTIPFDRAKEKKIVDLKYNKVELTMETVQQELDFDQGD